MAVSRERPWIRALIPRDLADLAPRLVRQRRGHEAADPARPRALRPAEAGGPRALQRPRAARRAAAADRFAPPETGAGERHDESEARDDPRPRASRDGAREPPWESRRQRILQQHANVRGDALGLRVDARDQRATQLRELLAQRGFRQRLGPGGGGAPSSVSPRASRFTGLERGLLARAAVRHQVQLVEHLRHIRRLDLLRQHADGAERARLARGTARLPARCTS